MIAVESQIDGGWGELDWSALATRAVLAAVRRSPFSEWIDRPPGIEISVKFASDDEVAGLNAAFRGEDGPTNVLSFPMVQPDLLESLANGDDGETLLGDIVLAHGVCAREAATRDIAIESHATHLIVHGALHLLGFDHSGDARAEAMEAIERAALADLGIADPYAFDGDDYEVDTTGHGRRFE